MFPVVHATGLVHAVEPVNRLSALFDRFLNEDSFSFPMPGQPHSAIPLTTWEDRDNYYVEMDVPGVAEKDIDVCIKQGDLLLCYERKCERQDSRYDTRSYGRFEQRVGLPDGILWDKAEARLANGVLTLALPKGEDAKPRKIAIRSE